MQHPVEPTSWVDSDVDAVEPPPPASAAEGIVVSVVCAHGEGGSERARGILIEHGGSVREGVAAPGTVVGVFDEGKDGALLRAVTSADELRGVPGYDGGGAGAPRVALGISRVVTGAEGIAVEEAVSQATELCRLALPGQVLITRDAESLINGVATVQPIVADPGEESDGETRHLLLTGLTAAQADIPERRSAPSRQAERDQLYAVFDAASSDSTGRLVAVVGPRGVGKSTFVERSLKALGDQGSVSVLRVRCRPADEGGTAWPLADLLEQAIGVEDTDAVEEVRAKIERYFTEVGDDPTAADWISGVLGLPGWTAIREETEWALRRFLSALGKRGAVVLAFDDADRADRGFWQLLADVASNTKGMALLVVLIARSVPMGFLPSEPVQVVELEPLGWEDLGEAAAPALSGGRLGPNILRFLSMASQGDLFLVRQIVEMLQENGQLRLDGDQYVWSDPTDPPAIPSKEEVVDSRLGWLAPGEQMVIGLASIVGDPFPPALIRGLVPVIARDEASRHLESLIAKGLISEDYSGSQELSFSSSLVREAAAAALPEEAKAEVHESCAAWLEESAGARMPRFGEIIGRHLASSWDTRMRNAAGSSQVRELGGRTAGFLEAAAALAAEVGDGQAALTLYERASSVLPHTDKRRSGNLLRSARVLADLRDPRAQGVLNQAENSARSSGARSIEWLAKMLSVRLGILASPDLDSLEHARSVAEQAMEALNRAGDEHGLSWAWSLKALISRCRGHMDACANNSERAAGFAQKAGDRRDEAAALRLLAWAVGNGPFSVRDAVTRCQEVAERVSYDRVAHEDVQGLLAVLMARQGRFHEARELAAHAVTILQDLAQPNDVARGLHRAGVIEMLAGERDLAERMMKQALATTEDARVSAAVSASLAHVVFERGGLDEVVELAKAAEREGAPDDVHTQVKWRTARAKALAQRGHPRDADMVVRRGLRLAEQTDGAFLRAEALIDLASILTLAGRTNEAIPPAKKALRVFERKGAESQVVVVRQIVAVLESGRVPR